MLHRDVERPEIHRHARENAFVMHSSIATVTDSQSHALVQRVPTKGTAAMKNIGEPAIPADDDTAAIADEVAESADNADENADEAAESTDNS